MLTKCWKELDVNGDDSVLQRTKKLSRSFVKSAFAVAAKAISGNLLSGRLCCIEYAQECFRRSIFFTSYLNESNFSSSGCVNPERSELSLQSVFWFETKPIIYGVPTYCCADSRLHIRMMSDDCRFFAWCTAYALLSFSLYFFRWLALTKISMIWSSQQFSAETSLNSSLLMHLFEVILWDEKVLLSRQNIRPTRALGHYRQSKSTSSTTFCKTATGLHATTRSAWYWFLECFSISTSTKNIPPVRLIFGAEKSLRKLI